MSVASAAGTINTAVGLAVTLGAAGLALEFVDRSIDRVQPRQRKGKRRPIFDTGIGNPRQRKGKRSNNIFDIPQSRSRGNRKKDNVFGGDFF